MLTWPPEGPVEGTLLLIHGRRLDVAEVNVIGFLRFAFALLTSDPTVGGNVECCPQSVFSNRWRRTGFGQVL